jgi:hypothetical protein
MIVATWMLEIPLWLQITLTVFLGIDVLVKFKETIEETIEETRDEIKAERKRIK